jgi:translocator protein
MQQKPSRTWRIVIITVLTMILGGLGGTVTGDAMPEWYDSLRKPSFQPPGWLFGPVWTLLYALMGIAAGRIWGAPGAGSAARGRALGTYSVQLALNVAWSLLFFGFRSPGAALVEIIVLWIAIISTIRRFHSIDKPAAWLLLPYLLWVSFATVLNAAIVVMNGF